MGGSTGLPNFTIGHLIFVTLTHATTAIEARRAVTPRHHLGL